MLMRWCLWRNLYARQDDWEFVLPSTLVSALYLLFPAKWLLGSESKISVLAVKFIFSLARAFKRNWFCCGGGGTMTLSGPQPIIYSDPTIASAWLALLRWSHLKQRRSRCPYPVIRSQRHCQRSFGKKYTICLLLSGGQLYKWHCVVSWLKAHGHLHPLILVHLFGAEFQNANQEVLVTSLNKRL